MAFQLIQGYSGYSAVSWKRRVQSILVVVLEIEFKLAQTDYGKKFFVGDPGAVLQNQVLRTKLNCISHPQSRMNSVFIQ